MWRTGGGGVKGEPYCDDGAPQGESVWDSNTARCLGGSETAVMAACSPYASPLFPDKTDPLLLYVPDANSPLSCTAPRQTCPEQKMLVCMWLLANHPRLRPICIAPLQRAQDRGLCRVVVHVYIQSLFKFFNASPTFRLG